MSGIPPAPPPIPPMRPASPASGLEDASPPLGVEEREDELLGAGELTWDPEGVSLRSTLSVSERRERAVASEDFIDAFCLIV